MSKQVLAASNQLYSGFDANKRSVGRSNIQDDLSPRADILAALVEAVLKH